MPTTPDNKANAAILLSADEAVLEKIRRVLTEHPEIVHGIIKQYEERIQLQLREAEYKRAMQQAMLNQNQNAAQQMRSVYTSNTTAGNVFPSIFGGKK